MVLPKSKKTVGLGNALMNDRFGKGSSDRHKVSNASGGVVRTDTTGQSYVTNAHKEASWVKMKSVTEQGALEDFLSTAELEGTDFTAEKMNNVKIIQSDQRNPYLLSPIEERGIKRKHVQNRGRLTVPRRPKWNEKTKPRELDILERASLVDWRRGLAELTENNDLLMTPFERNIEVWRQLWRVIERSDLIVQIVDARNPLLFRSEDLEAYVKEVDPKKRNLLLVNKADMMTEEQRLTWAEYFEEAGINYRFFSAHLAKELIEGRDAEDVLANQDATKPSSTTEAKKSLVETVQDMNFVDQQAEDNVDGEDEWTDDETENPEGASSHSPSSKTKILTVEELEDLFLENVPADAAADRKTTIGLVGYPNVGKSSTINALVGAKKVSVSATPGKTKHFQTINLSDRVILCDCPGLVFPNFASTKAELVCNGILPIDQLREFTGPAGLVVQRIPKDFLEKVYGIKIHLRAIDEGGSGSATASDLLRAYAKARGFSTTGYGQPDESRAARYVLKDYVSGKLLYCHPPPHDPEIDGEYFNRDLYDFAHLPARRQAWLTAHTDDASLEEQDDETVSSVSVVAPKQGPRARELDKKFFGPGSGNTGHLTMPFNHPYTEQGRAKQLSGRKAKAMTALEQDIDPADLKTGKRHFKPSRQKVRNMTEKEEDHV